MNSRFSNILFLFLAILLLVIALPSPGRSATTERYWLFLSSDSSKTSYDRDLLTQLRSNWPERSLTRRNKNGFDLTVRDLPTNQTYLDAIERAGATIICKSRWINAVSVEVASEKLLQLERLPFVERIAPVGRLKRDAMSRDEEYSLIETKQMSGQALLPTGDYGFAHRQAEQARAREIHERGGSGRGVLIGVLDTGFQLDHRAFAGLDLVAQYDFINHDPDPSFDPRTDVTGQANHGTACLSVIGGYDPTKLVGIAPRASFALAKTEDVRSETVLEEDYWIEAIEWFEQLGVDVVSSSLTYRDWYRKDEMDGRSPISRAAQLASELGMVICISAGNAGPGEITIGAPADAESILAIAAVDSSGRATNFSSRGPASDGRIKPDIAAMGRQVVCVAPMTFDRYARWNGTSLACPIVAGVAALVIEAHPDWTGRKVVEALRMSATQAFQPDFTYGYGLIDAVEAVDYPSVTVLLKGTQQKTENISVALLAEAGDGGETGLVKSLSSEQNSARFVNLFPGSYRVVVCDSQKIKVIEKSITVPPSGSILIEQQVNP